MQFAAMFYPLLAVLIWAMNAVLHESLESYHYIGGALSLTGVMIAQRFSQ